MLLGTLGAILLGNILAAIGITRAGKGRGIVRAVYRNKNGKKKTTKWILKTDSSFEKFPNIKILSK